jgi:uncharacterized protein (TIGR02246 family)
MSKRIRIAAVGGAVVTALVLTGCGTATGSENTGGSANTSASNTSRSVEVTDHVQEVRALFTGWDEALATLDPEKVADRYAPDAVLLPTVSNQVRTNRAEIVDYFTKFLTNKPRGTILESHVKVLSPNAAIDTGTYRFALADGSTVEARYTYVYERVNGTWLIVNHHSSAMPEG